MIFRKKNREPKPEPAQAPATGDKLGRAPGTPLYYLVSTMTLAVSANTSYRFFNEKLGIPAGPELWVMFAVLEAMFIACGYGMRASVRLGKGPGSSRATLYLLCAFSAYMAVSESGFDAGAARVALGPVLGMIALHHALGIERDNAGHKNNSTLARIGRRFQQWVLSLFGIASETDETSDAMIKRRARMTIAKLTVSRFALLRKTRLRRAGRRVDVANDRQGMDELLHVVAFERYVGDLATVDLPNLFRSAAVALAVDAPESAPVPDEAETITAADEPAPAPEDTALVTPESAPVVPVARMAESALVPVRPESITDESGVSAEALERMLNAPAEPAGAPAEDALTSTDAVPASGGAPAVKTLRDVVRVHAAEIRSSTEKPGAIVAKLLPVAEQALGHPVKADSLSREIREVRKAPAPKSGTGAYI